MNAARRRAAPRPRAHPHRFARDWTVTPDHRGQLTCWCGSLDSASVHRDIPVPDVLDVARLVAGDDDDD
jgi:hypothetical protein